MSADDNDCNGISMEYETCEKPPCDCKLSVCWCLCILIDPFFQQHSTDGVLGVIGLNVITMANALELENALG